MKVWRILKAASDDHKITALYFDTREDRDAAAQLWADRTGQRVATELWSPDHPQDSLNKGWACDGFAAPSGGSPAPPDPLREAVSAMADAMGDDYPADHMDCGEADTLARLFYAAGRAESAAYIVRKHMEGESTDHLALAECAFMATEPIDYEWAESDEIVAWSARVAQTRYGKTGRGVAVDELESLDPGPVADYECCGQPYGEEPGECPGTCDWCGFSLCLWAFDVVACDCHEGRAEREAVHAAQRRAGRRVAA